MPYKMNDADRYMVEDGMRRELREAESELKLAKRIHWLFGWFLDRWAR